MAVSHRSGPVGAGLAYARFVCNMNSVLEMVSGRYAIQIHLLTNLLNTKVKMIIQLNEKNRHISKFGTVVSTQ